jgi:putative SOS response-associated peptidase YedK
MSGLRGRLGGMCGRYASTRDPGDLVDEFEIEQVADDLEPIGANYNVAPTNSVYAVVERLPRNDDGKVLEQADGVRQLRVVTWGLVPSWAKDPKTGYKMINARMESVAEKPAFRRAFAARRCLIPADGYYEWYGEKGSKQPYFIQPRDGSILAMAGLYEFWRDDKRPKDDPLAWLVTCAVITTTAEDELGHIHDRMPMFVERDRYSTWLDPHVDDPDELRALLVPASPGRLEAYPVSTLVNGVENNGPELLDRIPDDEVIAKDAPPTLF